MPRRSHIILQNSLEALTHIRWSASLPDLLGFILQYQTPGPDAWASGPP